MFLNKLSLKNKLLTVLLPLGIVYSAAVAYYFFDTSDSIIRNTTLESEKKNSAILKNLIKEHQNKALIIAKIFASSPFVESAYLNTDEKAGSDFLMNALKPQIDAILSDQDIKDFQIHYHKYPAKSFLRTWTNKRFDDLSKFRPTILEVAITQKPLKAIEFGVGGFAVRGIAPIFVKQQYVGSVEFLYEIKDIMSLMSSDKSNAGIFNLVDASVAETALKKEQIEKFYSKKILDYYISNPNSDWIKPEELIDEETQKLIKSNNELQIGSKGNIFYSLNPLFDINNKKIGYVAFVKNNEEMIKSETNALLIKVIIIAVLVMIFILTIIFLVNHFIIKPIRKATALAKEIAEGIL